MKFSLSLFFLSFFPLLPCSLLPSYKPHTFTGHAHRKWTHTHICKQTNKQTNKQTHFTNDFLLVSSSLLGSGSTVRTRHFTSVCSFSLFLGFFRGTSARWMLGTSPRIISVTDTIIPKSPCRSTVPLTTPPTRRSENFMKGRSMMDGLKLTMTNPSSRLNWTTRQVWRVPFDRGLPMESFRSS